MIRRVTAYRASKILYNFLMANKERITKPFLLPVNICKDVPATFDAAGIHYRYVDINAQTLCMDEQYVLNHAMGYSGILMVHTYGVETDFAPFYSHMRELNPDILIVDDRCLCLPSLEPNLYDADLVLYSLGAKKQVNLFGGAHAYIAEETPYQEFEAPSDSFLQNVNWTLNEAELNDKIAEAVAHREALNAIYRDNLPKDIQLPEAYQHWRFNIMVENKQIVMQHIFDAGLFSSSHYAIAASQYDASQYKNARFFHEKVVNLFNDGYFTEKQAIDCCKAVNEALKLK